MTAQRWQPRWVATLEENVTMVRGNLSNATARMVHGDAAYVAEMAKWLKGPPGIEPRTKA